MIRFICTLVLNAVVQISTAEEATYSEILSSYGVKEIVFVERKFHKDPHWYANFGYYAGSVDQKVYADGAKLLVFDIMTGKVRSLIDDPKGGIRDPKVHYDGNKILFSYRRGGSDNYLLYEINSNGTG